jgi:phage terminase Nu1 subunit (DNA packaging protein)
MSTKASKDDNSKQWLGNRADLLEILDISGTTQTAYEAKGLIVKTASRQFDLKESVKNVIKHLRAAAGNHSTSGDLKEEKLQEEIRELRLANAKKEGELVDIEEVHGVIRKALVATADWMESLPDSFESRGIIAPGMTNEFIRVMDDQREILLGMVLSESDDKE